MRVTSLASGSSGNALLVEAGPGRRTRLLVDAGLSGNILIERLRRAGTHPTQLQGVLVTHEHSDHIIGLPVLTKRYAIPVITAPDTLAAIEQSLASTWLDEWVPTTGDTPISKQGDRKLGEEGELGEDKPSPLPWTGFARSAKVAEDKPYTCPPDRVPLLWTGFASLGDTPGINTQDEAAIMSGEQASGNCGQGGAWQG